MKKDTIEKQLTRRIKTSHALHEKMRKAIEALSKGPSFHGRAPLMDRLIEVSNALNVLASNLETDLAQLKDDAGP